MNERDLEARLRDAYRAEASHADPGALIERVHAIPTTAGAERPRWWNRLGLGASRSAGSGGIDVRGARNMLTATRIAAVVAALALGSTFLAVQVDDSPGTAPAPAATTGESWITVTGQADLFCSGNTRTCHGTYHDMSDTRLDGDVSISFSHEGAPESGTMSNYTNYTLWGDVVVANDGGTWEGKWVGFRDEDSLHHVTSWFEGTGEYEGLKYIEQAYEPEGGLSVVSTGLLFEGQIPETVVPPTIASAVSE